MIRVSVTQEDIDHGKGRQTGKCPVALAVKRATGAYAVIAYASSIGICKNLSERNIRKPSVVYDTPEVASAFIRKFDSAYSFPINQAILTECKPFDFVLTEQDRIR